MLKKKEKKSQGVKTTSMLLYWDSGLDHFFVGVTTVLPCFQFYAKLN